MAQSSAVNQPIRVPLAVDIKARSGFLSRTQRNIVDPQLINCYAEFNPDTKTFNVQKRPGYSTALNLGAYNPGSAAGQGLFRFRTDVLGAVADQDSFVAISNGKAYFVYSIDSLNLSATAYQLGTLDTTNGAYRGLVMSEANFANARVLVITNGKKAYYTAGLAGDLTQITDPQFPALLYKGFAYLNSRLYLGKPRNILQGAENLNDVFQWDTLNVILAQDESDDGVGIVKHNSFIVFFKEFSTEFFFDNGNPTGSPLLPSPQNHYNIGCFDVNSIRDIDGTIFWVTSSEKFIPQVARMDNTQYTIISTPEIDKILLRSTSNFNAITMKLAGHRFYILSLGTFVTLVYDMDQQLWYVWEGDPSVDSALYWPISDSITTARSTLTGEIHTVLQDARTGALYLAGPDYSQPKDASYVFPVDIYTSVFDAGIDRRKNVKQMYFDSNRVDGLEIQVRTNDFDYDPEKWTDFRTVNLDVEKPQLGDCGTFYRRAHHIRHQQACSFIIRSVGLQTDIGSL